MVKKKTTRKSTKSKSTGVKARLNKVTRKHQLIVLCVIIAAALLIPLTMLVYGTMRLSSSDNTSSVPQISTVNAASDTATSAQVKAKMKVFSSATVYSLQGMNFNQGDPAKDYLKGMFEKAPYNRIKVNYPASLAKDSISKGVTLLDKHLRATKGNIIVIGQSQGAQVASHWMRKYANDKNAPGADRLMFILTGNPTSSRGGYVIGKKEVGGTTGVATPTTTKWRIIDVARRYDGWADGQKRSEYWANKNSDAGRSSDHHKYYTVNLYDSTHTVWTNGNTLYVLTKETSMPMWSSEKWVPEYVRTAMQAHIEKAYDRPAHDPKVVVKSTPWWDFYWKSVMGLWGIQYK
jgi:hypothetical protein